MIDVASSEPQDLTDQAILDRFDRSKTAPPSSRTLGFRLVAVSQAEMRVEAMFDAKAEWLGNPVGHIQGGFVTAMLDEVMSVACMVASKMTCVAPTLEMKTSFLRPALPGALRGVGRVIKWGRSIAFTEGEIFDEQGRLLAKATGTAMPKPFLSYKTKA
jgi:uncharacterized protein (TIGR00369 family)